MIHNRPVMNVVSYRRLDQVALETPPNDVESFGDLPQVFAGLGGKTGPSAPGGLLPPQAKDGAVVVSTVAPPSRQNYTDDGGGLTSTPPHSVRDQERQKGVVTSLGPWKDAQVFEK